MSDKRISQLNVATALQGAENIPIVQGSETKKGTIIQIKNYILTSSVITELIAAIDSSIGTGWKRENFATTTQGTKADSAVQTSGSNYSFTNVISSTLVNLTISAGSVNWDADGRNLHKLVLTGNCTLENGSNPISGTQYQFIVEQDGTGNHTLSYGSLFKFPDGTAPTIPVAANSKSIITCLFDGTHYLAVSAENFS